LLNDHRSGANATAAHQIAYVYQITAAQLVVDRKIERARSLSLCSRSNQQQIARPCFRFSGFLAPSFCPRSKPVDDPVPDRE
jgi:hypothetical protein